MRIRFFFFSIASALLFSCSTELSGDISEAALRKVAEDRVGIRVSVSQCETRTSLGEGVESVSSGIQLFAYHADDHTLEGVYRILDGSEVYVTGGRPLNLYVIGNMWFLDTRSGTT